MVITSDSIWWHVGNVVEVAHHELKRVGAGAELDDCFGLTAAEMDVLLILGNRVLVIFELLIDQKVMVAGLFAFGARGRDT